MRQRRIGAAALLLLFLSGPAGTACVGEPRMLPPRAPPAALPPPVPLPPQRPKPGLGRLVIWTTDGPMRVVAQGQRGFQATPAAGTRDGDLCVTPCVVDVPPGPYRLFMRSDAGQGSSGDVDDVLVSERLNYYVRAPGKFEHPRWIPGGPTLIATLGLALILTGFVIAADSKDLKAPGLVVSGLGLGVTIGGGVMVYEAQRGSIQQGATTAWSVPLP